MIDLADEEDENFPQSRQIKRQKRMSPEVEELRSYDDPCLPGECANGTVCLNGTCQCSSGFVLKVCFGKSL